MEALGVVVCDPDLEDEPSLPTVFVDSIAHAAEALTTSAGVR